MIVGKTYETPLWIRVSSKAQFKYASKEAGGVLPQRLVRERFPQSNLFNFSKINNSTLDNQ